MRDAFSDISMSGMAGLELLRLVKAKQTAINESMIAAYGDEANHHKGVSSGSKEFIAKTILFDSLKVKIAKPINK
ncbi:hypothetical protein P872_06860 [Rhodonellum psychrophilum GCM71 = DSM 17998]|uniref:Response regulatory domain-containing protein n=2 Tax=Rhodonellum TaxID=336827 RepID=U5BZ73_9BACT|nr:MULTISPECIES: response regulator [Rhodonellum]ERM81961.1 hypothetical protein P872_06860 [Rhodonellum psychrophilum GCM71 = DSM 17998]SDY69874.1 Response regulator receiver domain-containing protein [Rhodonellum ikkaensis]